MRVLRHDVARLSKATPTPQGGLQIPATLTRTGILEYRNQDGSTRRELRLPEEVFSKDHLDSLRGATVTVGHPGEVTPDNYKTHAVGHVRDDVGRDGGLITGSVMIQDAAAIAAIQKEDLREISLGYSVDLDPTPGVWQGQRYDAVQRHMVTNHVALGPDGWGRCGSSVGLRLDAGDALTELPVNSLAMSDNHDKLSAELAAVQGENAALKEANSALKSRADSLAGENEVLKSRVAKALTAEHLDAAVTARVELVQDAKKILGPDFDAKGKSDIAVIKLALGKELPKLNLDASDDMLKGAFNACVSGLKEGEVKVSKRHTVDAVAGESETVSKVEKARLKFEQDSVNAWKVK